MSWKMNAGKMVSAGTHLQENHMNLKSTESMLILSASPSFVCHQFQYEEPRPGNFTQVQSRYQFSSFLSKLLVSCWRCMWQVRRRFWSSQVSTIVSTRRAVSIQVWQSTCRNKLQQQNLHFSTSFCKLSWEVYIWLAPQGRNKLQPGPVFTWQRRPQPLWPDD